MQAGLYNEKDELAYTWEELINKELIIINNNTLYECSDDVHGKIIISDNIEIIDDFSFYFCQYLTNIKILNNIYQIEEYAFGNCYKLNEIKLPKTLKKVGNKPFFGCNELTKIIYPGTREEFEQIVGWKNIFQGNNLTLEQIQFHKTLDDLIEEGKNLREANKILKEQKERAI